MQSAHALWNVICKFYEMFENQNQNLVAQSSLSTECTTTKISTFTLAKEHIIVNKKFRNYLSLARHIYEIYLVKPS